ncbi:sulfurtransferase, partial [Agromyces seonyuensis]
MPVPLLIDAETLRDQLGGVQPPRVLDVRWRLDRPDGRPAYREAHVPGAVYVDLDAELAEHGAPATAGRHPLPSPERFATAVRRWGLRAGEAVVVYDDLGGLSASRAWWLLRDAGVADVRVLDGGLPAWVAAGLPVDAGEVEPEPGDVVPAPGGMPVIDLDAVAALPERGVLLDARAGERYRGETEPIDPRAGHIPGALSAPTAASLAPDGRFLPVDALRERFAALGVRVDRPVAAYCGSGVTAAHEVFALALAGFDAALYPGSWSQWSNHPGLPVATGAEPGAVDARPRPLPALAEVVRTVAVLRGPGG